MDKSICAIIWTIIINVPILTFGAYYEVNEDAHLKPRHFWFPFHIACTLITISISIIWFLTGQDLLISNTCLWNIVQRGSIDALYSVISIVGIGSILLSWTYTERDRITLGKSQIDIIHHKLGIGYGSSIICHYITTVLSMILLKSGAKEPALIAFITVVLGCIPQIIICLTITLNRSGRENKSLELWRKQENKYTTVKEMAKFLGESEIYSNIGFQETICSVIADWLKECAQLQQLHKGITVDNIKKASAIFRELSERVPQMEQKLFEESVLKQICEKIEEENDERKEIALLILCSGYIRFLYAQTNIRMRNRIMQISYHFDHRIILHMKDFSYGLEWYQFITQQAALPANAVGQLTGNRYTEYAASAFTQMVVSIYEDDAINNSFEAMAELAWCQVYPGGE